LHEVARLAAENQARNIARLASQETGAARREIATVGGIEDVQLIDAFPTPAAPAATIETAPSQRPAQAAPSTAANTPLSIEAVWGTPADLISEHETAPTPIPEIQTNDPKTTGATTATIASTPTPTPTMTIEDVAIDEIEPEVRIPVQQDMSQITRAPVHQKPIVVAEPEPAIADVTVETIVVADIEPIVPPAATEPTEEIVAAESETPTIEIAAEPVEIEQTTTTESVTEARVDDTYVIIETIDLDAQIREAARFTPPAPTPIETRLHVTDIEIPVTTVAHTTETPITQPTEPTAAPIEVANPNDNVVIIETIEEVSIDPAPAVIPETKVQAKTETAVETPIRQYPTEPTPIVIIEDVPIDPITEPKESSD